MHEPAWPRELDRHGASGLGARDTRDGAWPTPPDLRQCAGTPQYDIHHLVRLVGLPATILWGWEQSLGVPRPIPLRDQSGRSVPSYSDRDIVAVLWLRDQINAGKPAVEAAHRLVAAQAWFEGGTQGWRSPTSGPLPGGTATAEAFAMSTQALPVVSGPLVAVRPQSGATRQAHAGSPAAASLPGQSAARVDNAPLRFQAPPLTASGAFAVPSQAARASGPLWASQTGIYSAVQSRSGVNWPGPNASTAPARATHSLTGTNGLRMLQGALIRAIAALDVTECRNVLDDCLRDYAPETTCLRIMQPVIERVGSMAASGQLTHVSERFAYITFRNRLASLLDVLPAPNEAPLLLLACAPGDVHELGPMMITVFWRRAGLRAVYLGANIGVDALVSECRSHRPVLLCLSAATERTAKAINTVADGVAKLDPPRPVCGFGGAAFVRNPTLQARMHQSVVYLGADAMVATRHALQLIHEGPLRPRA